MVSKIGVLRKYGTLLPHSGGDLQVDQSMESMTWPFYNLRYLGFRIVLYHKLGVGEHQGLQSDSRPQLPVRCALSLKI